MSAEESPIHFAGTIPNSSGTPRNEVGGLAIFEGVLMRSRTGFAMAMRRPDGSITLRQVPYASLVQRRRGYRLPVLRGAASLGEMMVIGTKALRYSAAVAEGRDPEEELDQRRLAFLLTTSALMMLVLVVFLPNLLAMGIVALGGLLGSGFMQQFNEADYPLLFNLLTGMMRLLILLGYVAAISLSKEVRRVFEYHGAEHKAVLTLEDGRDVTVGRAKLHDTVHPRCGTTFLAMVVLLTVIVFALADWTLALHVSGFPDWSLWRRKIVQLATHVVLLPLVIGTTFELMKWCARNMGKWYCRALMTPGLWMQRLTTRQPDDNQLEVAIVALFGALAIGPWETETKSYSVRGLEDDETAPGHVPRSPARPAPMAEDPGT